MAQGTFASPLPSHYNTLQTLPHSRHRFPHSITNLPLSASAYIHSFPYNRLEQLPVRSKPHLVISGYRRVSTSHCRSKNSES